MNFEPAFERVNAPYVKNLQLLGIDAKMRMVDPAQYQQRMKNFDFDITTERYTMRDTPGVELRSYFGSDAAKPHWYKPSNSIAYWDKFSRPETKPRYDRGVLDTWWYDKDKAAKLEAK